MNTKHTVIAADPPWSFNNNGLRDASNTHYGELSLDALKDLNVPGIAAPDCVLLLWGVPALVPEALKVVEAWGFSYVTMIPWFKLTKSSATDFATTLADYTKLARLWYPDNADTEAPIDPNVLRPAYGMGWWVRGCFEPLLIAKRGNPRGLEGFTNGHYLGLLSQNFAHSRKPDNIYDLGNQFPGPKVELFARRPITTDVAGFHATDWAAVGNEIDGRDIRDVLPARVLP